LFEFAKSELQNIGVTVASTSAVRYSRFADLGIPLPLTEFGMKNRVELENEVKRIIGESSSDSLDVLLEKTAATLHGNFPHYTGVYLYLQNGDALELGAFRGRPTEHTRIPIGAGVCGRAARAKQTVIVDDVNADSEYLACSIETRSEIVVPIMRGDCVLGEIDIDGDAPAAFTEADRAFLESVALLLAPRFR
jgi:L-methionine (R)-S-oxide reductase